MKIRRLEVTNFRGINKLEWNLRDERIFCLMGKVIPQKQQFWKQFAASLALNGITHSAIPFLSIAILTTRFKSKIIDRSTDIRVIRREEVRCASSWLEQEPVQSK